MIVLTERLLVEKLHVFQCIHTSFFGQVLHRFLGVDFLHRNVAIFILDLCGSKNICDDSDYNLYPISNKHKWTMVDRKR
eukprot:SAG31_NODE_31199_length_371_cov_0.496324_1_plen_78_part_10